MPFFNDEFGTKFWDEYRSIYLAGLTPREASKINDFDYVFFEKIPADATPEMLANLRSSFSPKAMQASLFIMLYRDYPIFQTSYQVLDALIEIDHLMSNWRHKHLIMVRRMMVCAWVRVTHLGLVIWKAPLINILFTETFQDSLLI